MKTVQYGVLLFLLGGCMIGPTLSTYEPAYSPAGVWITLTLSDNARHYGELLAVTEDDLTVLTGGELALVPAAIIKRIKMDGRQTSFLVTGRLLSNNQVRTFRPLSRFPAGIPENVVSAMLERRGQESIRILTVS